MSHLFSFRFSPRSQASRLAFSLAALVALSGCSSKKIEGRKDVFPAHGKLLIDEQPAPGALLVLHPVGGAYDAERPRATVAADGSFTLSTYEAGDGAPAGEYVVTAQWHVSANKDAPGPWPNVLPAKYARPESSDLRVQIATGSNDLPPMLLRR